MMKSKTIFNKMLLPSILYLALLISCQPFPTPNKVITTNPTSSAIPTSVESFVPPTSEIKHELTYLTDCETGSQCMYAVEIACIESENPCPGKPQILFHFPKTGENPKAPVLFSSWSPDGQQVAVVATGVNGRTDIYV